VHGQAITRRFDRQLSLYHTAVSGKGLFQVPGLNASLNVTAAVVLIDGLSRRCGQQRDGRRRVIR
jgi:hypothetical protein